MHGSTPLPPRSFWQSRYWDAILTWSHQAKEVIVLEYHDESILIEIRSIWLGFFGAFSLGVDMRDSSEGLIEYVRNELKGRNVLFWQREEYVISEKALAREQSKTYGKHFLEPWTEVIDLTLSEEQILASMHEKWRYNIRLAEKRGVTTEWVSPTREHIDICMGLLRETTERDDFSNNSRSYYEIFLSVLTEGDIWGLLFASLEGKVIAAGIYVYYEDTAIYYYGASTSDPILRKSMAPYLLQWEAIREGKRRGCQIYDFLWVAPPGETDHPLSGVTFFKERFSSRKVSIGKKDLIVYRKYAYTLFRMARKVREL